MNAKEPKSYPILMKGEMVRAIREGRKTQTRRVVNPQPDRGVNPSNICGCTGIPYVIRMGKPIEFCPYGNIGDQLWVREKWYVDHDGCQIVYDGSAPSEPFQRISYPDQREWFEADYEKRTVRTRQMWRPSIHMPRWACRINLEITSASVERIKDISFEDCLAEGVEQAAAVQYGSYQADTIESFQELWDSINAGRGLGWAANPWVWALGIKRLEDQG